MHEINPLKVAENGGSLEINHPKQENCIWEIAVPDGKAANFHFSIVDGENFGFDHSCETDMFNIVGTEDTILTLCGRGLREIYVYFTYLTLLTLPK